MPKRFGLYCFLISGIFLLMGGAGSVVSSIRRVSGGYISNKIYFYWSFHTIQPISKIPPGPIVPPVLITVSEILIPWLLIGLLLISAGLFLLYKSFRNYRAILLNGTTLPPVRQ